jgi:hypothetical protein
MVSSWDRIAHNQFAVARAWTCPSFPPLQQRDLEMRLASKTSAVGLTSMPYHTDMHFVA